jgi:hypothetical protein
MTYEDQQMMLDYLRDELADMQDKMVRINGLIRVLSSPPGASKAVREALRREAADPVEIRSLYLRTYDGEDDLAPLRGDNLRDSTRG